MIDFDWYKRTMLDGRPIPVGVTINPEDHRANQSCKVCGELVDASGPVFTKDACSEHAGRTA